MPYHVLPHYAVEGAPGDWLVVLDTLLDRGLPLEEALMRIRFAYTGNPAGALPDELL